MTSAVVLGLQILLAFLSWLRETQQLDAGRDKEIALAAAAILMKTQTAKQVMAEVTAMTDSQVDEALKKLEPQA